MAGKKHSGVRAECLECRRLLSGGYLDVSFGGKGLATGTLSGFGFRATDVAVRSDGKIVVAGTASSQTSHATFIDVARFNSDGTLDKTFGSNGMSSSRVPGTAAGVALQSDNKIIVVGTDLTQGDFAVVRFTANGALDTSFNHSGVVGTSFGGNSANAADVSIQKDGKIVVAGSAFTGSFLSANFDAAVARYNTDGSLDKTFGSGGQVAIGLGDREYGEALTIDYVGSASSNPDYGKIVVVGAAANTQDTTRNFLFARLKTNGALDKSFHHTGKFSSTFVSEYTYSDARGVVVEPNNKIVVVGAVGTSYLTNHNFGVVRLNSDGSGDSTFGPSNGQTEVDFGGNDAADSVILSKTGDLLVGGVTGSKVALVALKSSGLIDKSFGPNGTARVTTAGNGNISALGLALAPGGKFVVAGGDNFATERYFDRSSSTVTISAKVPDAFERGQVPAVFDFFVIPNPSATTRVFFTLSGSATSPFSLIKKFIDYTGVTPAPPPPVGTGGTNQFPHLNQGYVDVPAGQSDAKVTVYPVDDKVAESNESIIFTLAPNANYDINPAFTSATATIHDDDSASTSATLGATADAYVHDGSTAGSNFGSATDLEVKKGGSGFNRVSYLKFDLSSVSTINTVTLDLFGKISDTQNANISVSIFSVADTSWSETGITFNNAPATSSTALAGVTVTGTALTMYQFDVTSYVKAQFAAGHKIVSFALKNSASTNSFIQFNSREAASNRPALVIT